MNIEMETHGVPTIETATNEEQHKGWRKVLDRVASWLSYEDKNVWLEQMRGNLGLIATVIATMTFQMALNPPGGVRSIKDEANPPGSMIVNANPPNPYAYPPNAYTNSPSDVNDSLDVLSCILSDNETRLCPGEAVLAVVYVDSYARFLYSNTICFIASLSILLLLVSGIPLHHRLPMWMLSIGMWVTLTTLAISYITAVEMTTPSPIFNAAIDFLGKLIFAWMGLLAIIALCHTLRFVIWVVKFFFKKRKNISTRSYSS